MTFIPLLVFFTKVNNNALRLHVKQWHYINDITLIIRHSPSTTLFHNLTRKQKFHVFCIQNFFTEKRLGSVTASYYITLY